LSNEQVLLDNYASGYDIHKINASKIFKKAMEEVTSTERSVAKAMTFGLLYGKGQASFVEEGIFKNMEEAEKAFNDFYAAYPSLASWMQSKRDEVLANGFIFTAYGDKIHIPFDPSNEREVASAQRDAVNYPIQHYSSCSAGLTFKALYDEYLKDGIDTSVFAFTHDAVDLDVHIKDFFTVLYTLKSKVNELCENLAGLFMENDPAIGVNFGDQFEYKILDDNTFEFTGSEENVKEICRRLSNHYDLEISYEDAGVKVINLRELFLKSAYTTLLDKEVKQIKAIIVKK